MARFDKYDPKDGGFRAVLGWAPVAAEVGDVIAVAIDGSGRAVKAAAATTVGVVCMSSLLAIGDPVDVMTDGEIVDVAADGSDNIAGPAAGAFLYAGAAGAFGAAPAVAANGTRIGHFVEAWRLVVRVSPVQG